LVGDTQASTKQILRTPDALIRQEETAAQAREL